MIINYYEKKLAHACTFCDYVNYRYMYTQNISHFIKLFFFLSMQDSI